MVQSNNIPREDYTRPIYIKTRKSTLTVNFVPQLVEDFRRSTLFSRALSFYSEDNEYPFWNFVIKTNSKKPPVRINIDDQSYITLNKVLYSAEDNCWASVAAAHRYLECKKQLDEKHQIHNCYLAHLPPEYLRELAKMEKEREDLSGIADCVDPLVVCKFVNDGWHEVSPGRNTTGATMLVYYQPGTKTGEPVKRPWTIEIRQYQLAAADGVLVHKNEVSQSIQLSVDEINTLLKLMTYDYVLWAGFEPAVAFYKANPEGYRRISRSI